MRAGRLRHRLSMYEPTSGAAKYIGEISADITASESAMPSAATGLRTGARVNIRTRYDARLKQGVILSADGRLFHAVSVRDPMGKRAELVTTCEEFSGKEAVISVNGCEIKAPVFITYHAPYYDDFGKVTDYKTKVEYLIAQLGRLQQGDLITINGKRYQVLKYVGDTDDTVTRSVWVGEYAG